MIIEKMKILDANIKSGHSEIRNRGSSSTSSYPNNKFDQRVLPASIGDSRHNQIRFTSSSQKAPTSSEAGKDKQKSK